MANTLGDLASDLLDVLDIDTQTGGQLLMCLVLLIVVVAILWFWRRLERSRIGRAFAAVKADEHAAELSGIPIVYYKMMSFLFSAFFAGVAGALFAHTANFISPTDFSWHKVVNALLYCVFGGSNVMWGSPLGAVILTVLPELLRDLAEYRDMLYGIMLVALMAFRPDGILSYDVLKRMKRKRPAHAVPERAAKEGDR